MLKIPKGQKVAKGPNIRITDERDDQADEKAQQRQLAEEAVQNFENLRSDLVSERDHFEEDYPEAHAQLQVINQIEDAVRDAIATAKSAVGLFGSTVGDFKVQQKTTKAHYEGNKLLEELANIEDDAEAGRILKTLVEAGVVKEFKVDRDSANVFFPRHPDLETAFADAYDPGGKPMTPAVTVPKL